MGVGKRTGGVNTMFLLDICKILSYYKYDYYSYYKMGSATFDQQSRLTVSLPTFQLKFVNTRSRRTGKAKSQIIQDALRLLEAKELDEQLKEGALANAEQDLDVAEEERVTFWSL